MTPGTILVALILIAAVAGAIRSIWKSHKSGTCIGCSGGCTGCSGSCRCDSCGAEDETKAQRR